MGNYYRIFCMSCKEMLFLGKENSWYGDKELMYILKDFLLNHINHILIIGGDEWNCAYDFDSGKQLPTEDYKEYDATYSKQDYADEIKEEKE